MLPNLSMLNGIIDDIKNRITAFFSLIPKLMYMMITMIFSILDLFQSLFRKVAGLDAVYFVSDNGVATPVGGDGNDIVLTILSNNVIRDAMLAMILLATLLLFVFTIIAILKTEYNSDDAKSASKSKIIAKSLRALGMFFLVPVICYMGIFLSNFLLMTLDQATATLPTGLSSESAEVFEQGYYFDLFGTPIKTTNTPFSGMAFRAAAFNANRIRNNKKFADALAFDGESDGNGITFGKTFLPTTENSSGVATGREIAASRVDDAFANTYLLKEGKQVSINNRIAKISNSGARAELTKHSTTIILDEGDNDRTITMMSKFRVNLVWFFYDLWQYDFVLGLGVVIAMTVIILNITLGVMKRVFDLVILTIVAPPIAAMMPLDNGDAFKKWRVKYVAKTIQAYGPIVAMNLFFMIVPFIRQFSFFGVSIGGLYIPISPADYLIQSFFVIVGLVAVKDTSKLLSDMIGAEDANESGGKMAGEVTGTAMKSAAVMSKGVATLGKVGIDTVAAPGKALKSLVSGGKKEGQEAYDAAIKDGKTEEEARGLQRQARMGAALKGAGSNLLNPMGSALRGSLDMMQQTNKSAFAGTDYAKAIESADKGKYGFGEIMKNISGGKSTKFEGFSIGKSKFFTGKSVKDDEKELKDAIKKEKLKREVAKELDAKEGKNEKVVNQNKAFNDSKSGTQTIDNSKFGKVKAEKANRVFDQLFTSINSANNNASNLEFTTTDADRIKEDLLRIFRNEYENRPKKGGSFKEDDYKEKIKTQFDRYIQDHGYKIN